ncbi:hypothetical protein WJX73_010457 [Symbiochloris irregularis]|uniref:Uncharacterized protein n=1 Tax=Symbiochloris irregularis TaxID=706552 RepID=A0AAW1NLV0_9CHLO
MVSRSSSLQGTLDIFLRPIDPNSRSATQTAEPAAAADSARAEFKPPLPVEGREASSTEAPGKENRPFSIEEHIVKQRLRSARADCLCRVLSHYQANTRSPAAMTTPEPQSETWHDRLMLPKARAISSMDMDSTGQLIISATAMGHIRLHSFKELQTCHLRGLSQPAVLAEYRMQRRTAAVRWSRADQNWAASVSVCNPEVPLYDISRSKAGPTKCMTAAGLGTVVSGGFNDMAFHPSQLHCLLAGGHGQQVCMWDTRAGVRPRAIMRNNAPVMSLQMSQDGHLLFVGTEAGTVALWDLRGGKGAPAFGAKGAWHYSQLDSLHIPSMMERIPQLRQEVGDLPQSCVQSIALDPRDDRRLAFNLRCGWSGVVDISGGALTHIHCPSLPSEVTNAAPGEEAALRGYNNFISLTEEQRQPCWSADGNMFAVPMAGICDGHVALLDFSPGHRSPCAVPGQGADYHRQGRAGPTAVRIPIRDMESPNAVIAAPFGHELVAGTHKGHLLLLDHGSRDGETEHDLN